MLKRLIEVALPLKEVSEQSAREKSIRHGHISTLHIWWARRPLAACRAVMFASLIPDPDEPECPESFRTLVRDLLGRGEFKPKGETNGEPIPDTPRNRCLEFIKHLVKWENSNNPEYIEPARKLIAAAHKILHRGAEGDAPKVLDPFAGGGAIPLEALRLGCEAHAIDLNPVAHFIELCTLVYPQKYGQPDSRPVPDYIKRLVAHNRAKKKGKDGASLFDTADAGVDAEDGEIIPDVEITEAEYRKNPLAADMKFWGHWILNRAREAIGRFYPPEDDGSVPVAYLWARTVKSPDPTINATIPLIRQLWLCRSPRRDVALKLLPNHQKGRCEFSVVEGEAIDFDPEEGTMRRGDASCPFTGTTVPVAYLRSEARAGRMGHQLICVVSVKKNQDGKIYRAVTDGDTRAFLEARESLTRLKEQAGDNIVPNEPLPPVGTLGFRVNNYGLTKWGDLFNDRQSLSLVTFVRLVRGAVHQIRQLHDPD
jgi:adenine-specific DNA methylase